jgi:hypothetical protein
MVDFIGFVKKNPLNISAVLAVVAVIAVLLVIFTSKKSTFKRTLVTPPNEIDRNPPMEFTPLTEEDSGSISLENPVVPEEIGLAMIYPQGAGASMSKSDSNSFEPTKPGSLLTDYTIPQSYGESSLSDPMGDNGAGQGARILRIKNTGNQLAYKPVDESMISTFAGAYDTGEVQDGSMLINGAQAVNYENGYIPNNNLKLQASPGQSSDLLNCETTYPNVVKYNNMCITEGDIPYGQVVDGKVNPRLVSRWESFTGDYSREGALQPIDGVLYPNLNVLVK